MEITNTTLTQSAPIKQLLSQQQKANGADNLAASRQVTTAQDKSADKNAGAANDTVNLSPDSLELAKSAKSQITINPAPLTNSEQAKNAAAQLVSDIRSYPNVALNAYGAVSAIGLKSLLG